MGYGSPHRLLNLVSNKLRRNIVIHYGEEIGFISKQCASKNKNKLTVKKEWNVEQNCIIESQFLQNLLAPKSSKVAEALIYSTLKVPDGFFVSFFYWQGYNLDDNL